METETPVCQTGKTGREAGARAAKKQPPQPEPSRNGWFRRRPVPVFILIIVVLFLLFYILSAFSSLIPMLGSGLANAISGTSYASADSDLLGRTRTIPLWKMT
ncbi:MAG: hypothetical protein ACLT76_18030 [Clostridium fessum]